MAHDRHHLERLLQSAYDNQRRQDTISIAGTGSSIPKFRLDYTLGLAAVAIGILLVMFPPQTDTSVVIWLAVLLCVGIYPLLHLTSAVLGKRRKYASFVAVFIGIFAVLGVGFKIWPELRPLRDLSNDQLRNKEHQLTYDMRKLERNYINRLSTDTESSQKASEDFRFNFQERYLAEATQMRCELLRREDQPCLPVSVYALNNVDPRISGLSGMVAGAYPLSNIANYLDELVSHLQ